MPIKVVKLITNNFGLKFLALVISMALWMIVVNVDDPKITRNFTTTVNIENSNYLTDQGKWYEIPEDGNTVTFSVSGKRSYLEKMTSSDFKAVADLSNLDDENKVPIDITVQIYSGYVSVSSKARYLTLAVEDLISQPFVVSVQTVGDVADGYALGETSVSPSILRVTGPESQVKNINKVVASVQVDGISQALSDSVTPTLYDEYDVPIDTSDLTLNVSNILVGVTVLNTKEVGLDVKVNAEPDDGYMISSVKCEPETLLVKGESKTLKRVSSLDIWTDEDDIDLSGAAGEVTAYIDISNELPDGISLVNSEDANVAVTIELEELETKTFEIPTQNLEIEGLASGYTAEFTNDTMKIKVTGTKDNIAELSADDIVGSVDVGGLPIGIHEVDAYIDLDDTLYEVGENTETEIRITLNSTR